MPSCLIPQRRYNVRSHADLYQDKARGVAIDITRVVHCYPGLSQRMRQRDVTCHPNFVLVMKPPVYLNPMFVKDWLSVTVMRARVRLNTICLDAGISLGILPEISLSWAVMAAIGLVWPNTPIISIYIFSCIPAPRLPAVSFLFVRQ
ncbi:hypothetical protein BKA56DRAFT_35697 [Ilyonectria sp. MPI-CAGE-AT-0026]|nr:hypothetical protein BKA56DRAFT_35697 [Ilyonectria sp. MPI-CAGE-AT-0026]